MTKILSRRPSRMPAGFGVVWLLAPSARTRQLSSIQAVKLPSQLNPWSRLLLPDRRGDSSEPHRKSCAIQFFAALSEQKRSRKKVLAGIAH